MTSKSMTFRFPAALAQAIDAQSRATGRDRTTIVTEALAQMFGLSLPSKPPITIEMLQQQVENLENHTIHLAEQFTTLQQATRMGSDLVTRLELLEQFNDSLRTFLFHRLNEQPDAALQETHAFDSAPQATPQSIFPSHPLADVLGRIVATLSDPLFVCTPLHQLLYINPLGARSLGISQHLTTPPTLQDLNLPSELKVQLIVQMEAVFATGRSITSEFSLPTSLYGLRYYEYTLSPIQGTLDQIQAVLFSTRDITDRKQVEAALRELEAKYQTLFESTTDSILILDALTRRILNANTNASKQLGYTRQELAELSIDDILPQQSTEIISEFQQLRSQDSSIYEHQLRHKDGTQIPVKMCNRLVEYGDRLVVQSFVRSLHDLT